MNPEDAAGADDQFLDRLAAYDEALAAGHAPDSDLPAADAPHVTGRLKNAQTCLRRLEDDRQRILAPPDEMPLAVGDVTLALNARGELTQLGRFQVIRELGRGGGGIVYLAVDPLLRREVALKVPRTEALGTPELRRRFLREAQAAAGLDHPNVVAVHEVGEVGPFCYLVSTYCPGPSLAAWLKKRPEPVPPEAAAKLVATLAEAVHYVHGRGILHRDLKPANILLAVGSEQWAVGSEDPSSLPTAHCSLPTVPKIADFGLAKWTAGDREETKTGTVVGTPRYMAPEQAEGRRREIGPTTDVYSLGVILYELLTGRTPFQGDSNLDVLKQIVTREPAPPRHLRARLPRALEAVCLKCLEKDPRRRYATAAALAEDLRRFLAGESTLARPAGTITGVRKRVRRHRTALTGVVLVLVTGLSLWLGARWYDQAAQARREIAQAARRQHYGKSILAAQLAQESGQWRQAAEFLDRQRPAPGEEDLRGFEWYHLWRLCHPEALPVLEGHSGEIYAVAVAPDGKTLASAGLDPAIKLWDAATAKERATLRGHTVAVHSLAFAPDGKLLASGAGGGRPEEPGEVKLWDAASGRERTALDSPPKRVNSVAFSPDGTMLAAGGGKAGTRIGQVRIWDITTGQTRHLLEESRGDISSVAFAPDGRTLAVGIGDGAVGLWDLSTGRVRNYLTGHKAAVWSLVFAPDGKTLASGSLDHVARLWDLATLQPKNTFYDNYGQVFGVAFAPDGRMLASASDDQTVHLWDVATGRPGGTLTGHTESIRTVAFTPDGRTVVSAGADGTIRRWRDAARVRLRGHPAEAWGVAFAPDGRILATAGDDHVIRLWDTDTGRALTALRGPASLVACVAFAPNGKLLASGDYDRIARLWDVATGREQRRLIGHRAPLRCLAFAPDGRTLATGGKDYTVRLWDVATGTELATLEGHHNKLRSVAFAPDGQTLASASEDRTIRLWDVATRQPRLDLPGTDQVWCLAFAPDGRTLAAGNERGTIHLWDVATGAKRATLNGHLQGVKSLAFTPDGKRLASGSDDQTIKLWDPASGQELLTLKDHRHPVNCIAFAPDGQTLASVSHDGAVRLWLAGRDKTRPRER